jgi:hypothetical protein
MCHPAMTGTRIGWLIEPKREGLKPSPTPENSLFVGEGL